MVNWSFDGIWEIHTTDKMDPIIATVNTVTLLGRPWITLLGMWERSEEHDDCPVDIGLGCSYLDQPVFINPDHVLQMRNLVSAQELQHRMNPNPYDSDCPICGSPARHGMLCEPCDMRGSMQAELALGQGESGDRASN